MGSKNRDILFKIYKTTKIWNRKIISYLKYKVIFGSFSFGDTIRHPLYLTPKCIYLGKGISIWPYARIEGVSKFNNTHFNPVIIINDHVSIQQNIHLTCAGRIEIGINTAIAAFVTITDIHHPYTDIIIPIERQDIIVKPVIIGNDCKIYNNVVILPGTVIGNHVTVGANSVVSGSIPDYSVVVGMPARIVKRYDFEKKCWRCTDSKGVFINK